MDEEKKFRFSVTLEGQKISTDHVYTMDEVRDLQQFAMRLAKVASGGVEVRSTELRELS